MCHSLHVAINKCINCCFVHLSWSNAARPWDKTRRVWLCSCVTLLLSGTAIICVKGHVVLYRVAPGRQRLTYTVVLLFHMVYHWVRSSLSSLFKLHSYN